MDRTVQEAAEHLAAVARELGIDGTFAPADPQQLSETQVRLDLPPFLVAWYAVAAPYDVDLPAMGNSRPLIALDGLEATLVGYRYHGLTGEELDNWDPDWLVIGGEDEYPLIVKRAGANDAAIYYGNPTKDGWLVRPLSSSLAGFLLGVAGYLLLYVGQYKRQIYDDDFAVSPHYEQALAAMVERIPEIAPCKDTWLAWLISN